MDSPEKKEKGITRGNNFLRERVPMLAAVEINRSEAGASYANLDVSRPLDVGILIANDSNFSPLFGLAARIQHSAKILPLACCYQESSRRAIPPK
jgi:hypothetical protein